MKHSLLLMCRTQSATCSTFVVAAPCENGNIISSLVTKGNPVFLFDID